MLKPKKYLQVQNLQNGRDQENPNEYNLLIIIYYKRLIYYKNYSPIEAMRLVIKFLAFYIGLYVFVNMIFIHLYAFI